MPVCFVANLTKSDHIIEQKKYVFGACPNQNFKTTFIVQTFPNFGLQGVYSMNFNFGDFWALFRGLFLVHGGKTELWTLKHALIKTS